MDKGAAKGVFKFLIFLKFVNIVRGLQFTYKSIKLLLMQVKAFRAINIWFFTENVVFYLIFIFI